MRTINEIRNDIDKVDIELKEIFKKRLMLVLEMKEYKKAHSLEILDKNREEEILNKIDKNEIFKDELIDLTKYLLTVSKSLMNK